MLRAAICTGIVLHDPASTATSAAASQLQRLRRVAGVARRRTGSGARAARDLALLLQSAVLRTASGQHPSVRVDRNIGVPGSRDRHRGRTRLVIDRRRGDHPCRTSPSGGTSKPSPSRAPTIGRGVLLSTGATILGDLSVGDFAKIGAGSVVTCDVPGRMYRGRRAGAADQLSADGGSGLNAGIKAGLSRAAAFTSPSAEIPLW